MYTVKVISPFHKFLAFQTICNEIHEATVLTVFVQVYYESFEVTMLSNNQCKDIYFENNCHYLDVPK